MGISSVIIVIFYPALRTYSADVLLNWSQGRKLLTGLESITRIRLLAVVSVMPVKQRSASNYHALLHVSLVPWYFYAFPSNGRWVYGEAGQIPREFCFRSCKKLVTGKRIIWIFQLLILYVQWHGAPTPAVHYLQIFFSCTYIQDRNGTFMANMGGAFIAKSA